MDIWILIDNFGNPVFKTVDNEVSDFWCQTPGSALLVSDDNEIIYQDLQELCFEE